MRKKRILMVSESSFLATGYSVVYKSLLEHFHKHSDYVVAELGTYGSEYDPRHIQLISDIPWKFYGNLPNPNDPQEVQKYNSNAAAQFGCDNFEKVALDFQPDYCLSVRDTWYEEFHANSPFRRFYKWIYQPTVDSYPQLDDWIDLFSNADAILTYTDWSLKVLEREGGGLLKLKGSATPGVDLETFKPVQNKKEHKKRFGLPEDSIVIFTCMRNQKRKLYPDLFISFAKFLKEAPADIANRAYLYVHSSFPDLGFDFPRLIKNNGIANKTIFTYLCSNCHFVMADLYHDVRNICPRCKKANMTFPSTQQGLDRQSLAQIYNLGDVYVQYAIAEALAVPIVEAAACGMPIFSLEYSGPEDVLKKLNGIPVKYKLLNTESETGCFRAFPDNEDLVSKLIKFLELPEYLRVKKGKESRAGAEKYYDWKTTLAKWEKTIDEVPMPDFSWNSSPRFIPPVPGYPNEQQMPNEQFVNWALVNVMGRPDLINSFFSAKILRDLTWGSRPDHFGGTVFNDLSFLSGKPAYQEYNRERLMQEFSGIAQKNNHWEQKRWEKVLKGEIK